MSKALNLKIDNKLLKPAGKNTLEIAICQVMCQHTHTFKTLILKPTCHLLHDTDARHTLCLLAVTRAHKPHINLSARSVIRRQVFLRYRLLGSESKVDAEVRLDGGCLGVFVLFCFMFFFLFPVVGIKLDVSAWMASFINTTLRTNVSYICTTKTQKWGSKVLFFVCFSVTVHG